MRIIGYTQKLLSSWDQNRRLYIVYMCYYCYFDIFYMMGFSLPEHYLQLLYLPIVFVHQQSFYHQEFFEGLNQDHRWLMAK
jgi:hypothetical protein